MLLHYSALGQRPIHDAQPNLYLRITSPGNNTHSDLLQQRFLARRRHCRTTISPPLTQFKTQQSTFYSARSGAHLNGTIRFLRPQSHHHHQHQIIGIFPSSVGRRVSLFFSRGDINILCDIPAATARPSDSFNDVGHAQFNGCFMIFANDFCQLPHSSGLEGKQGANWVSPINIRSKIQPSYLPLRYPINEH